MPDECSLVDGGDAGPEDDVQVESVALGEQGVDEHFGQHAQRRQHAGVSVCVRPMREVVSETDGAHEPTNNRLRWQAAEAAQTASRAAG